MEPREELREEPREELRDTLAMTDPRDRRRDP